MRFSHVDGSIWAITSYTVLGDHTLTRTVKTKTSITGSSEATILKYPFSNAGGEMIRFSATLVSVEFIQYVRNARHLVFEPCQCYSALVTLLMHDILPDVRAGFVNLL